jgi:hypothetical protein
MFSVYKLALLIMFQKIYNTHCIACLLPNVLQCNMQNLNFVCQTNGVLIPTRFFCLKNYYFIRAISFIWLHEIEYGESCDLLTNQLGNYALLIQTVLHTVMMQELQND